MNGRPWTKKEVAALRRRYPNEFTATIARDFRRSTSSVYAAAAKYGIKKSADHLNRPECHRLDGSQGVATRFVKGQEPPNKGMKGWDAGGRSHETRFRPGQRPQTWLPVGSYRRTTKERFWILKVQDHGSQHERWIPLHKLIWIEHNGPIATGHVVRFIDGDVDNVTIENLECITRVENMRRNTLHNLPKPVVDAIQQKGRLTREINKQRRAHEEQHRRPA